MLAEECCMGNSEVEVKKDSMVTVPVTFLDHCLASQLRSNNKLRAMGYRRKYIHHTTRMDKLT